MSFTITWLYFQIIIFIFINFSICFCLGKSLKVEYKKWIVEFDPAVNIRDGSIVTADAGHFGNKDWAEKYYGVVIRLVKTGKCARVKWNKDSTMSCRTLMIWFWKKKFKKKKSLSYEFNPWILNEQVISDLKQYLLQMSLQLQITLILDKSSLIYIILVNNIVIITYEIFESLSHILKAYNNKNAML